MAEVKTMLLEQAHILSMKYGWSLWFIVATKIDFEKIYNKKSWISYELQWLKCL